MKSWRVIGLAMLLVGIGLAPAQAADDRPDIDIAFPVTGCGVLEARNFNVSAHGRLMVGGPGAVAYDGQPCDGTLIIRAARVTVASTGLIDASSLMREPGPGTPASGSGGGAGFAGVGGDAGSGGVGGPAYSPLPAQAGSPGAAGTAPSVDGAGGGVIRIAADTIQIDGTIRADGGAGHSSSSSGCDSTSGGGGSGGHIELGNPELSTADLRTRVRVGATGLLSVRGGPGGNGGSGGGGGSGGWIRVFSLAPGPSDFVLATGGGTGGLASAGCRSGHSGATGKVDANTVDPWATVGLDATADPPPTYVEHTVPLKLLGYRDAGGALRILVCQRSIAPDSSDGLNDPRLLPPPTLSEAVSSDRCTSESFDAPTNADNLYQRSIIRTVEDGFHGFYVVAAYPGAANPSADCLNPGADGCTYQSDDDSAVLPKNSVKVAADDTGPLVAYADPNGQLGCLDDRLCVNGPGTLTVYASDGPGGVGLDTVRCRLNGAGAYDIGCGPGQVTVDLGAGEGVRDLEIRAVDKLGNETVVAGPRWFLDRTPPVTTIDSGPADPTDQTTVSFTFHANEPATFECSLDTGTPSYAACESGASYGPLGDGEYVFRVRGTDLAGNTAATPTEHRFTVATNKPPTCADVVATPGSFDPATRDQFKLVTLSGASDPDGDSVAYRIDGVAQDEPVTDLGDDTSPDAKLTAAGADTNQVLIRAERSPKHNGRVYRIAFTVSDGAGATCSATVLTTTAQVAIPRKPGGTAVDDFATTRHDSFTGAPLG